MLEVGTPETQLTMASCIFRNYYQEYHWVLLTFTHPGIYASLCEYGYPKLSSFHSCSIYSILEYSHANYKRWSHSWAVKCCMPRLFSIYGKIIGTYRTYIAWPKGATTCRCINVCKYSTIPTLCTQKHSSRSCRQERGYYIIFFLLFCFCSGVHP